jgi:Tfp pilus assembly protein PilP
MGRLRNRYFIGLFLQGLLIFSLSTPLLAEQKEENVKDNRSPEAIAETQKLDANKDNANNYIYDPTNKTDPFKSFIATMEEKEKNKTKTYLETLELSQLDLVVTVISPKGRWAMVRDSKGLGHVIKEGTPIGTNNGVVFKISQGQVVIHEEYKDFRGQTQYKEIIKEAQPQM